MISHVPEILNQGSLLGGVKAGQRGGRWELENVVLVWYTFFEVFPLADGWGPVLFLLP